MNPKAQPCPPEVDKTTLGSVKKQVNAMGSELFELGLYRPSLSGGPVMRPRVWDTETIIKSIAWLRHQNREGSNIYIRPRGEHDLTMIDDLTTEAVSAMRNTGFNPAVVVETSPGNFQAWLKHPETLTKEMGTAVARVLAEKFGGDRGAADWRHFGRLAGFTNRKEKHRDTQGRFPYARLIEATGAIYPEAERFLATVSTEVELRRSLREHFRNRRPPNADEIGLRDLKSIDVFRVDSRYGGDGTRVDLAYAVYALSRGVNADQVATAIRSRDLSHKGNEHRQDDYITRTIKKALASIERSR